MHHMSKRLLRLDADTLQGVEHEDPAIGAFAKSACSSISTLSKPSGTHNCVIRDWQSLHVGSRSSRLSAAYGAGHEFTRLHVAHIAGEKTTFLKFSSTTLQC